MVWVLPVTNLPVHQVIPIKKTIQFPKSRQWFRTYLSGKAWSKTNASNF